jgi:hypothetical protein
MIKDMMVVDKVFNDDELLFIENQAKNLKFYDNASHPEAASWVGYRTENLLNMSEKYQNLLHQAIATAAGYQLEPKGLNGALNHGAHRPPPAAHPPGTPMTLGLGLLQCRLDRFPQPNGIDARCRTGPHPAEGG